MTLLKKYKIIITVLAALLSVSMILLTVQTVKRLRTASDEDFHGFRRDLLANPPDCI